MRAGKETAGQNKAPRTVGEVMTRDIYAVAPDSSIETAARLLTTKHITGAPVVASDGRPIGVLTLSDLADVDRPRTERDGYSLYYKLEAGERVQSGERLEVGDGFGIGGGRVADIMSDFVLSIHVSSDLETAGRIMLEDQVHRLLVVDQGKLVGIVTVVDLLRGFVEE